MPIGRFLLVVHVLAQKTWGTPPLTGTYAHFQKIMAVVGSREPRGS
ncbi:MAG: hypothetical protein M3Y73_13035 [Actinomycetota bacterium]|nr:hypothetical protein [Actinomycetota bacterium]